MSTYTKILAPIVALAISLAGAQEDYTPKAGEFPPFGTVGRYLTGELIFVDHVNRMGALRLAGDGESDRYHAAPSHQFALLPYGSLRYHGAPAELRDIPIGTNLHGYFFLPPEGNQQIPPLPDKGPGSKYGSKYTHALSLEDDASFYQRQGQTWKIETFDLAAGTLGVTSASATAKNGLSGKQTFFIDESTRVWKDRQAAEPSDLAIGQEVRFNLTWSPKWEYGEYHCLDIWTDFESFAVASERQRRTHLRHIKTRWMPGWVDSVEPEAGGRGRLHVTLFSGMDPSLYEEFLANKNSLKMAPAEWTLRSWWQDHDGISSGPWHGPMEVNRQENPSPGSSGIQLSFVCAPLLEGFRPGRIVRIKANSWPNVKLPPEERVKNMEERVPNTFQPRPPAKD